MPEVIIAGAGIAGISAAHTLLKHGFDVTLLEADDYLGGSLGAPQDPRTGDYHEHCYHMYLNWYHNFWAFMDEIGVRRDFMQMPIISYIQRNQHGKTYQQFNHGSPWTALRNLFSGPGHPANAFIYDYSLLDLIGTTSFREDALEKTSVHSLFDFAAVQYGRGNQCQHESTGGSLCLSEFPQLRGQLQIFDKIWIPASHSVNVAANRQHQRASLHALAHLSGKARCGQGMGLAGHPAIAQRTGAQHLRRRARRQD